MSDRNLSIRRRERSTAGSLSEYSDTSDHAPGPSLVIKAQSQAAHGKQPVRPSGQLEPLAWHSYRWPSVIPSSEDGDVMEGVNHYAIEDTPGNRQSYDLDGTVQEMSQKLQHLQPSQNDQTQQHMPTQQPQQYMQQPQQYLPFPQYPPMQLPQQYLPLPQYLPSPTQQPQQQQQQQYSPKQQQQYLPPQQLQLQPPPQSSTPMQQPQPQQPQPQQQQQYSPLQQPQQYLPLQQPQLHPPPQPSPSALQPQQPQPWQQQQYMPQWYAPPQYAPQPYMPARYPQQSQANPVLDSIATQIANIAVAMDRRQEATDRRQETVQNELTSMREARTNPATTPALKPGDVATSEPRNQTDSNAASRFIDSIRDAVSYYGEERTRVVLRRCCKETATEDWLAGMSDHDCTRLRASCSNWVAMLE